LSSSYLLLLWFHLLAAIGWIGGMLFLSLVLAPLVRSRKAAPEFMALFRSAARRFRLIVWTALALLFSTGPWLVHQRGWNVLDPTQWPSVLLLKVSLVAVLLMLTLSHDLLIGPRLRKISAIPEGARSSREQALVLTSAWLPRAALVVALGVVASAVVLARS
jgi:copper resistance protein D